MESYHLLISIIVTLTVPYVNNELIDSKHFSFKFCSNVEKVQHIEVFVIETSKQNNNGLFENGKGELREPPTILIPDENTEQFKLNNMSKEDKEKVKEQILSFMDRL